MLCNRNLFIFLSMPLKLSNNKNSNGNRLDFFLSRESQNNSLITNTTSNGTNFVILLKSSLASNIRIALFHIQNMCYSFSDLFSGIMTLWIFEKLLLPISIMWLSKKKKLTAHLTACKWFQSIIDPFTYNIYSSCIQIPTFLSVDKKKNNLTIT